VNFTEKMVKLRQACAPHLTKDAKAPSVVGGYQFHSSAQVLDVVRKGLDDLKLTMAVDQSAEVVPVDVVKKGQHSVQGHILVAVTVTLGDGESNVASDGVGISAIDRDTAAGVAFSYAVKNALLKLLVIGEGGEDPEMHVEEEAPTRTVPDKGGVDSPSSEPVVTKKHLQKLADHGKKHGMTWKSLGDLTKEVFGPDTIITKLTLTQGRELAKEINERSSK